MAGIWAGETSDLNGILDAIIPEADAVLAKNK
jgi:hypothetical protein